MAEIELNTDTPDEGTGTDQEESTNENLLAGKYKDQDALVNGYKELERKFSELTAKGGESTDESPDESTTDEGDESAGESADESTAGGLDWDGLNGEYAKDGKLSDATYKDLEAKGFPKAEVNRYIAGRQAEADAFDNSIFETVGGKENFGTFTKWAADNYTQAQKDSFNKLMDSGDAESATAAVSVLQNRYEKANGKSGKLLNGKGGPGGAVNAFKSQAEVTEAMRSSKYRNDPAYREEVANRLAASTIYG